MQFFITFNFNQNYCICSKKFTVFIDVFFLKLYQQMEHLQSFIKDCDRKIQIAKKRLEETQDDHDLVPEVCMFSLP